jgi:hypothetical protein
MHLVRAHNPNDAFLILRKIVAERRLIGGDGFIRGGFKCVCFTEAPIQSLREVFSLISRERRSFQPYGVMMGKEYLFSLGGRPVIYQPDAEFDALPAVIRYRHVRYDPTADPPIDFTWEREWRLRTDELDLSPSNCVLIVRTDAERETLLTDHADREYVRKWELQFMVGAQAELYPDEDFPWLVMSVEAINARLTKAGVLR